MSDDDFLGPFRRVPDANKTIRFRMAMSNGLTLAGSLSGSQFVRMFRDPSQLEKTADAIPAGCVVSLCLPVGEITDFETNPA
jgi:hypothetical protein